MQLTLLHGYPDYVGKRLIWCGNGIGPASYVQVTATGGGDPLALPGFQNYIDVAFPALTISRTYLVIPVPVIVGSRSVWRLKWTTQSSGTEVSAAVNLASESVQIGGFGGVY